MKLFHFPIPYHLGLRPGVGKAEKKKNYFTTFSIDENHKIELRSKQNAFGPSSKFFRSKKKSRGGAAASQSKKSKVTEWSCDAPLQEL